MSGANLAAKKLAEWLAEMNYAPRDLYANKAIPTADQLSRICTKTLAPLWERLAERVKPIETVKMMRGNLELCATTSSSGSKVGTDTSYLKLLSEHHQHTTKLAELSREIAACSTAIAQLSAQLDSTAQASNSATAALDEYRLKETLLEAFYTKAAGEAAIFDELSSRLSGVTTLTRPAAPELTGPPSIEEPCARELQLVLDASQGDGDHEQAVQALYSRHTPVALFRALQAAAAAHVARLQSELASADASKDAEALGYSNANGEYVDAASSDLTNKTSALLQAQQEDHFNRFLETESIENAVVELDEQIREQRHQLQQRMAAQYSALPAYLEALRAHEETAHEAAALAAEVDCLEKEIEAIEATGATRREAAEALQARHREITEFTTRMERRQVMIRDLLREAAAAGRTLRQRCTQLVDYSNNNLSSASIAPLVTDITAIRGRVASEGARLAALPLTRAAHAAGKSASLVGGDDPFDARHAAVLGPASSVPGVQSSKSMDSVLQELSLLLHDVSTHDAQAALLASHNSIMTPYVESRRTTVDALAGRVNELRTWHRTTLLPAIAECDGMARQLDADRQYGEARLREWMTLPAAHATPWLRAGGKTYAEWEALILGSSAPSLPSGPSSGRQ
eukprot:m.76459 g.76459  ORF g.76459 m.76459 type:complete len:631 (+) comp13176_c0_seq2:10-1902(+)